MKNTRLVVKRKGASKQVSSTKKINTTLIADQLNSTGRGGGIINILLPQTKKELEHLEAYKKNHAVVEVTSRNTHNQLLKDYFQKEAFINQLYLWIEKHCTTPLTYENFGITLSSAQSEIINTSQASQNLLDLKNIFRKHAPMLLTVQRAPRWWEDQFTNNAKKIKNKSLKIK